MAKTTLKIDTIEVSGGPVKKAAPKKKAELIPMPSADVFLVNGQEVNMALIEEKKKEYAALVIKDTKDTKGIEAVTKALATLRTTRTTIDKVRLEGDAPIRALLSKRKENADKMAEALSAGEKELKDKLDVIDTAKQKEKDDKEAARQKLIAEKRDALVAIGYVYDKDMQMLALPDKSSVINMLLLDGIKDKAWADLFAECEAFAESYDIREAAKKQKDDRTAARKLANNDLARKYNFSMDGFIDQEQFNKNAEDMSDVDWDAYFAGNKTIMDTEHDRRHTETVFNQLVADRTVQIKALFVTYTLPMGFFPDIDAVAKTEDPETYAKLFAEMEINAQEDQDRRNSEAQELKELRELKNNVEASGFTIRSVPMTEDEAEAPVEDDTQDSEGEPTPDIELVAGRLQDDSIEPLDTDESKTAATRLVMSREIKTSILIIKNDDEDVTEFGISFGGPNPAPEDYFAVKDDETAIRLRDRLAPLFPPVN